MKTSEQPIQLVSVISYHGLQYRTIDDPDLRIVALIRDQNGTNILQQWSWEDFTKTPGAIAAVRKEGGNWEFLVERVSVMKSGKLRLN